MRAEEPIPLSYLETLSREELLEILLTRLTRRSNMRAERKEIDQDMRVVRANIARIQNLLRADVLPMVIRMPAIIESDEPVEVIEIKKKRA